MQVLGYMLMAALTVAGCERAGTSIAPQASRAHDTGPPARERATASRAQQQRRPCPAPIRLTEAVVGRTRSNGGAFEVSAAGAVLSGEAGTVEPGTVIELVAQSVEATDFPASMRDKEAVLAPVFTIRSSPPVLSTSVLLTIPSPDVPRALPRVYSTSGYDGNFRWAPLPAVARDGRMKIPLAALSERFSVVVTSTACVVEGRANEAPE